MSMIAGPEVLVLLVLISMVAGAAKGLTGFGGALVMAPLFSLLIPAHDVGTLVVLVHCATSLQGARQWRPTVRWQCVVPLGVVAIACTALTAYWLAGSDTSAMRRLVAIVVLLVTLAHISGWRWHHAGGWPSTVVAGAVSGVLTALGGLGGPPAVYYFNGLKGARIGGLQSAPMAGPGSQVGAQEHSQALRANLLGYFMVLFSGATLLLIVERRLRVALLATALILIPAFALGVRFGERYSTRLPKRYFDAMVSGLLLASGLVALLS